MTNPNQPDPNEPATFQPAYAQRTGRIRCDGWTGAVQADFLEALAGTAAVSLACEAVGKAESGAYVLRHAPRGRAFAFGWRAALLIARDRLEDIMLERAALGTVHVTTRDEDGTITRRTHNHHQSIMALNRIDRRLASGGSQEARMARVIATDFGDYLNLVASEPDADALWAWLEARADPVLPHRPVRRFSNVAPLVENFIDFHAPPEIDELSVWLNEDGVYVTDFPPPEDFDGEEVGEYGEAAYRRTLTEAEDDAFYILTSDERAEAAERLAEAEAARDRWFGFAPPLPDTAAPLYEAA